MSHDGQDACSQLDLHANLECPIFADLVDSGVVVVHLAEEKLVPASFYQCIAPLRLLLLKDSQPDQWAAVKVVFDDGLFKLLLSFVLLACLLWLSS